MSGAAAAMQTETMKEEIGDICEFCEAMGKLGFRHCSCGRKVNEECTSQSPIYCQNCLPVEHGVMWQEKLGKEYLCPTCGNPTRVFIFPRALAA